MECSADTQLISRRGSRRGSAAGARSGGSPGARRVAALLQYTVLIEFPIRARNIKIRYVLPWLLRPSLLASVRSDVAVCRKPNRLAGSGGPVVPTLSSSVWISATARLAPAPLRLRVRPRRLPRPLGCAHRLSVCLCPLSPRRLSVSTTKASRLSPRREGLAL